MPKRTGRKKPQSDDRITEFCQQFNDQFLEGRVLADEFCRRVSVRLGGAEWLKAHPDETVASALVLAERRLAIPLQTSQDRATAPISFPEGSEVELFPEVDPGARTEVP